MTASPPHIHPFHADLAAYLQPPGGWFMNNAGWFYGPEQTLLIDTCATEARTRRLPAAVQAYGAPAAAPLTVVLTHGHGDHANGAGLVAAGGGTVMASKPAADVIASGPHTFPEVFTCSTWGDITPPGTVHPITDATPVDVGGGRVAEVMPVPERAHTDGDLVVFVPRDGVLFTGDLLFIAVTPLALHGSIGGWLTALGWLNEFDAAHLVSGHGPISSPGTGAVAALAGYLRWLLDVVDTPSSPDFDELSRQAQHRWSDWSEAERHAVNLRVAHAEVHGYPLNIADAISAMLRAAGGKISLDI